MAFMKEITADDIEALAVGAWILGTGGGGSPYHGLINMRRLYRQGTRVSLMDAQALETDDDIAVVSDMGAPLVSQERLVDSRLTARAVELMQEYLGRRFRGVMSIEIGGNNAIQPLMAAAHLGIPFEPALIRSTDVRRRSRVADLSAWPQPETRFRACTRARPEAFALSAIRP